MLVSNFFSHHLEGSIYFMAPLTIMFLANIILFGYILIKKDFESKFVVVFKHIGFLIFGFGMVGTLIGFLKMFDALGSMEVTLPLSVISGGVKVALLNVVYGAGYFCISHAGYIAIKIVSKRIN